MSETQDRVLNEQLVLICGHSATGKSASLENITNPEKWFYLGCEAGKALPFKSKFKCFKIEFPEQVIEAFDYAIANPNEVEGIIIDSLTFLMEMYESQNIVPSTNKMAAWSEYQQYFKKLMQDKVLKFGKPTLILAHTQDFIDEASSEITTYVPIKGALKATGIESYFTTVVATKKVAINELEAYKNDMLHISEEDEIVGFKYVFQTKLTKKTRRERIRSPKGMFSIQETYMDNCAQTLLNHIKDYYN